MSNFMFKRAQYSILSGRLQEPRRFMQVLSGPRQVGKTTLVRQALAHFKGRGHYASADLPSRPDTGWVEQQNTLKYYNTSDIFCFPSVREFGGAVVLEAMANGLPCIVINNGGIAEYVTDETGFKINPISRDFVVQELKGVIGQLVQNQALRLAMSLKAIQRAKEFSWSAKAEAIVSIYNQLLEQHN